MPNDKPKTQIKKLENGNFEKVVTIEHTQSVNLFVLEREKLALENRLKEINEDIAELKKLGASETPTDVPIKEQ